MFHEPVYSLISGHGINFSRAECHTTLAPHLQNASAAYVYTNHYQVNRLTRCVKLLSSFLLAFMVKCLAERAITLSLLSTLSWLAALIFH